MVEQERYRNDTTNYTIITDEQKLLEFISWLPTLESHEKYYLCLFARNKYCKQLTHIKSDKAQLKRFVSDKERMYWKIKQLEIQLDCYRQKEIPVPQEAIALYITVNPRDMYEASGNTAVKLTTAVVKSKNYLMNPHQEALSEIQKAKSRTCYVDFDIDENDSEKLAESVAKIKTYVNVDAVTWLQTRGGLHVLVDPKKVAYEFKPTFYKNIASLGNADQAGDQLIPIPGTYQGGFTPKFVDL